MKMKKSVLLAGTAMSILGGPSFAADLPMPAELPPSYPAVFSWSGLYLGAHGGALWQDQNTVSCDGVTDVLGEHGGPIERDCEEGVAPNFVGGHVDAPGDPWLFLDDDYAAFRDVNDNHGVDFLVGGQLGIRQQYGRLVVGLEGDFSGVFGDDNNVSTFDYYHQIAQFYEGTGRVSTDLEWLSTFRASIGGTFGAEGRFLAYATGGLALAGVSTNTSFGKEEPAYNEVEYVDWCQDGCFFDHDDDHIQVGFAVGVGGEYAFTNNLSFGVQYLFMHFDDDNSVRFHGDDGRGFDIPTSIDNIHQITGRVNFKFAALGQ